MSALMWPGHARQKGGQLELTLDDHERVATIRPIAGRVVWRLRAN